MINPKVTELESQAHLFAHHYAATFPHNTGSQIRDEAALRHQIVAILRRVAVTRMEFLEEYRFRPEHARVVP